MIEKDDALIQEILSSQYPSTIFVGGLDISFFKEPSSAPIKDMKYGSDNEDDHNYKADSFACAAIVILQLNNLKVISITLLFMITFF